MPIQTAEDIVELLGPVAPSLVFLTQAPRGTPSAVALHAGEKICDFLLKSPFISETVRDKHIVSMEHL